MWTRDFATPVIPPEQAAAAAAREAAALETAVPQASVPDATMSPAGAAASATQANALGASDVPTAAPPTAATATADTATAASPAGGAGANGAAAGGGVVRVVTDVLELEIGLVGGELRGASLPLYPVKKGSAAVVRLLNRDGPEGFYVLQSGLAGTAASTAAGAGADAFPTHLATFSSPSPEFRLEDAADELRVPLTWTDGRGVTVTKTFVLRRGQYRIDLEYAVQNASAAPWAAASYAQILRDNIPIEQSMFSPETYAFKGPAYYDGQKYQKVSLDDADKRPNALPVTGGWIAGMQHYFVTAVVPPVDATTQFTLKVNGQQYLISTLGSTQTIAPGASGSFYETLWVGPKLQAQLEQTGPELDRVADYGMLTILARPLFLLLQWFYDLVGNWGWAIVLATLVLKLLFYPLSEKAGKSMAKMKALAPRMKQMQETYKDDREKLGRAMMELYQKEKINPVAGCLPILIQMPVFLAFYWVLLESVEMRQAPFIGWINDLSSRDPFFVLPAIMAAAMFGQYKLNPAPPDPIQAKVFMIMPFAMSVMFAFFPAGLVLYWVTNTVLSIAQQWNINRRIEAQLKKA
jgi:YidC/Oxa1 family membrane protein insertase